MNTFAFAKMCLTCGFTTNCREHEFLFDFFSIVFTFKGIYVKSIDGIDANSRFEWDCEKLNRWTFNQAEVPMSVMFRYNGPRMG